MTSAGPGMQRAIVATGPDALVHADLVLSLGPHHPANQGSLRLRVVAVGEAVIAAEPLVGLLHRGAEKLFEVRDYRQILVLANRHDWLSAFAGELGVCLVVEEALGLPVPDRAVWIRMLLAELTRVSSHLAFLGAFPTEVGTAPAAAPNPLREKVLASVRGAKRGPDAPDGRPARRAARGPTGGLDDARPAYRCRGAIRLADPARFA